jgi:hypothetical protein
VALAVQGVQLRPGDILCVRTGWIDKYLALDAAGWEALAAKLTDPMGYHCAGLSGSEEMSRFLWDSGAAAVVADNPAVETVPMDLAIGSLHVRLIPSLGFAIGNYSTSPCSLPPATLTAGTTSCSRVSR